MNPKKNPLWNISRDISAKYYYMMKFERIDSDKFVEDNEELTKVGKDMFDNYELTKNKTNFFVDICAAPGMYSKIILDTYNETTGIGISLPLENGGVKFEIDYDNYKIFYKDILKKEYKLDIPKKLDFGIASCVSYIADKKRAFLLNMELIITSANLILNNLDKGGNLIINLTMKNIYVCYNILNILSKYFSKYKLWKSDKVWGTKNTFYFFGYGFKQEYNNNLLKLINEIENKDSKFTNTFTGTKEEFDNITKKMNTIYIVRINSWLQILSNII